MDRQSIARERTTPIGVYVVLALPFSFGIRDLKSPLLQWVYRSHSSPSLLARNGNTWVLSPVGLGGASGVCFRDRCNMILVYVNDTFLPSIHHLQNLPRSVVIINCELALYAFT